MAHDDNNKGVMFVNEKKEEGSKQPDRKGHITIDNVKYWLSGWAGKSQKDGTPYLSLKAERAEEKYQPRAEAKRDSQAPNGGGKPRAKPNGDEGDGVPF